jgi:hypothetical protein
MSNLSCTSCAICRSLGLRAPAQHAGSEKVFMTGVPAQVANDDGPQTTVMLAVPHVPPCCCRLDEGSAAAHFCPGASSIAAAVTAAPCASTPPWLIELAKLSFSVGHDTDAFSVSNALPMGLRKAGECHSATRWGGEQRSGLS